MRKFSTQAYRYSSQKYFLDTHYKSKFIPTKMQLLSLLTVQAHWPNFAWFSHHMMSISLTSALIAKITRLDNLRDTDYKYLSSLTIIITSKKPRNSLKKPG